MPCFRKRFRSWKDSLTEINVNKSIFRCVKHEQNFSQLDPSTRWASYAHVPPLCPSPSVLGHGWWCGETLAVNIKHTTRALHLGRQLLYCSNRKAEWRQLLLTWKGCKHNRVQRDRRCAVGWLMLLLFPVCARQTNFTRKKCSLPNGNPNNRVYNKVVFFTLYTQKHARTWTQKHARSWTQKHKTAAIDERSQTRIRDDTTVQEQSYAKYDFVIVYHIALHTILFRYWWKRLVFALAFLGSY